MTTPKPAAMTVGESVPGEVGQNQNLKQKIRYLTAKEVAERYSRPLSWVYRCKRLPARKIGKYLVYREDELEKFEELRTESNRGYVMRPDAHATYIQKARKRLKFDIDS